MVPRRDNKQWVDACREADIAQEEIHEAADDFHAEKRAAGERGHWPYRKLTNWLRKWKEDRWRR